MSTRVSSPQLLTGEHPLPPAPTPSPNLTIRTCIRTYLLTTYVLATYLLDTHLPPVQATLDVMQREYLRFGVLFEFYDADDTHDPRTLMRKGEPTGGVRDYHWSAALAYDMIVRLSTSPHKGLTVATADS